MGQKVNPIGLRLGINKNWSSRWFPNDKTAPSNILEDYKIRTFLKKEMYYAGVSEIIIERAASKIHISVVAARPGIIIGKKGADIEKYNNSLKLLLNKDIKINVKEAKKPLSNAQLCAESVATQLEKRVAFRRAMKKVMQGAMKNGAKGIKIKVAGRLAGAEMARTEWYMEGRVPLHTLRAKIDYGFAEAMTTYGIIGVKIWVFKGEVLQKGIQADRSEERESREDNRERKERRPRAPRQTKDGSKDTKSKRGGE